MLHGTHSVDHGLLQYSIYVLLTVTHSGSSIISTVPILSY